MKKMGLLSDQIGLDGEMGVSELHFEFVSLEK